MASVSKLMLKTRWTQWKCHVQICKKIKWDKYKYYSAQACKYVTYLSRIMRYSSIINYYQTIIFYHNVKGRSVASWSDVLLSQTVKGINKSERTPEDVKDALTSNVQKCKFFSPRRESDVLFSTKNLSEN